MINEEDFWKPNSPGQAGFLHDTESTCVALSGGWWGGKTWAGARKLVNNHLVNATVGGRLSGIDSLVVSQTRATAFDFDIPEIKSALDEARVRWEWRGDPSKFMFYLPDLNSNIRIRTAESPESIAGFGAGSIWLDEAARFPESKDPSRDPITQCYGRLRADIPDGGIKQMLFTYTNEGDATRVYQDFELKPKPGHKLYRVATNENPVATRTGFFDLQRGLLGADEAEQYLMGHAMHVGEGKAFPKFDRAVHVKPTPYSKHLHLCWCLDFNVSPFCTGVTQSENGDVFVIAEIEKKDNGHTAEMCEIFFDRAKELGWNLDGLHIYGDPSGDHRETVADKNHTDWRIVRNALDSRKINYKWCVPLSHSDRLSTVNAVRAKLRSADGKVRASIDPSCEGIINDLMTAEWPSDLTENHRLAWLRYYINREWPIRIEAGRPTGGVVGFSKGFTPATTRPTSGAVGLSAGFGPMLGRPR